MQHTERRILPSVTAWMEVEVTILSEINQPVKDKYHMISLIRGSNEQNKVMSKTEPDTWKKGID